MDEDDIVELSDNVLYDLERRIQNNELCETDSMALIDYLIDSLNSLRETFE